MENRLHKTKIYRIICIGRVNSYDKKRKLYLLVAEKE